jgi:hypothetical protein
VRFLKIIPISIKKKKKTPNPETETRTESEKSWTLFGANASFDEY